MSVHPFEPLIFKSTKKLLIGTLPPEGVRFYFSNSSNTRLWDILSAIDKRTTVIDKGGNDLSSEEKKKILNNLRVGISDIIYQYKRDDYGSTSDRHIDPKEYKDLLRLAVDNNIDEFLFVYQSAFKWFIHSLEKVQPIRLRRLKYVYSIGLQPMVKFEGKIIRCILLPSPLNRGRKGETLGYKLEFYRKYILD